MSAIRVGVLRGGPGHEYEVSLETGAAVLKHLPEQYAPIDLLLDKAGQWHVRGLPVAPAELSQHVDVVFNALHGEYGEDGRVQNLLDNLGLPYTGSGMMGSALGMNKHLAKEVFRRAGLQTPRGIKISAPDADLVFKSLRPPWVAKPLDRGSSVGLGLARSFPELAAVLQNAFKYSDSVLVEEYVTGREATVGVVDQWRGATHHALPAIEIRRPSGKAVWDYADKYSGATEEICPGNFSKEEKVELEALAVKAHQALGLRDYSRSDFIVTPRGIFILETNSLPGLTTESLLPKALTAVGAGYGQFLDHVLTLALNRK